MDQEIPYRPQLIQPLVEALQRRLVFIGRAEQAIDGGRFSVLVDQTGTFIKQSFTPDSP
jgi:hypothetical protein